MPLFETENLRLFYRWEGRNDRPTLVLSHSLGCSCELWREQVAALGEHFRILLYDHRGHGRSESPEGEWSIDDFGCDLVKLLDHPQLEAVNFCGLSLGGMVGMWLAQNASDRIGKLVLCNTAAQTENPSLLQNRIRTIEEEGLAKIVGNVLERWFTMAFRQRQPARVAEFRSLLEATSDRSYAATSRAVCDLNLTAGLPDITHPALVIYGTHDTATPPSWNLAIAKAVRNARSVELPTAHLSNVEAAAEFNRVVLDFMSGSEQ
ncbi:MAG: 3-oxoadipate enol-lactonase [Limisphaerales bacterium]